MAHYKRRIPHKRGRHRCSCCGRTPRISDPNRKMRRLEAKAKDELQHAPTRR